MVPLQRTCILLPPVRQDGYLGLTALTNNSDDGDEMISWPNRYSPRCSGFLNFCKNILNRPLHKNSTRPKTLSSPPLFLVARKNRPHFFATLLTERAYTG
ncbi:hypothetical protein Zmor_021698 [Zophobas morio]|uniref:Uncharacterized protein n=1 Tax=Zophobas morio TaxID=2755281 RepID=A0AA38MAQ4_9CUCU|nr:hypothetical protein Zmor_021698 [Zophobas morio]